MKPIELLKAEEVSVKALRTNIFNIVKGGKTHLVTKRGKRIAVLIPYRTVVQMLEVVK